MDGGGGGVAPVLNLPPPPPETPPPVDLTTALRLAFIDVQYGYLYIFEIYLFINMYRYDSFMK